MTQMIGLQVTSFTIEMPLHLVYFLWNVIVVCYFKKFYLTILTPILFEVLVFHLWEVEVCPVELKLTCVL